MTYDSSLYGIVGGPLRANAIFSVVRDKDIRGGYHIYDNESARLNIPFNIMQESTRPDSQVLKKGLLCFILETNKTYRFVSDPSDWPAERFDEYFVGYPIEDDWQEVSVGDIEEMYYTNLTPVPQDLGGVNHGESFNEVPLQKMWDKLLYPELEVKFDRFRINGTSILTLHEGQTSSSSYTFSWQVNNGHLLDPEHDITIRDDQTEEIIYVGPSEATGSETITGLPEIEGEEGDNYFFTISGMDIYGNPLNRACRIRWIAPLPPDTYPVTLGTIPSGVTASFSGQGNYEAGDKVTINIFDIDPKYSFLNWYVVSGGVDLATPHEPNCTFYIGELPVEIRAVLKEPHQVFLGTSVIGGGSVSSSFSFSSGSVFAHEETVDIELTSLASGYTFSHWTVEYGGAELDDTESNPTFFEMPDNDVSIIAHVNPPPTINMYYGAASSKDENLDLDELQSTGTTQQDISHPNQVVSSFVESFDSEYIVIAHPEDWYTGDYLQVTYQLGGQPFGLSFEETQVYEGIVYRVYFSGLRQNRINTDVYII